MLLSCTCNITESMRSVTVLVKLNSNWEKEIDHKYLDTLDSIESNMTVNELKQKRNERNLWTDSLNSKFKTSQKELNVL
jgi:hypothetical protein